MIMLSKQSSTTGELKLCLLSLTHAGNETFEKLGTVGSTTNLVVYLTTVFNMKSVTATTAINIFNGTASIATLVGAFLSDTYFGRYKSLGFASVSSFLGMLVLMLTAAVPNLHPSKCVAGESSNCIGPAAWQLAFLLSAFGFLVIGAGGIRPCNLAFGADQFNPNSESGKKGISSFFNWYYLTYTFAVMVSVTIIVYVQSDVSWAIGLGIPALLMFLSCTLFFLGTRIYVIVKPQGSPLTSVVQVLVAAAKKRELKLPENLASSLFNFCPSSSMNSKLRHTSQLSFLDKAAIVTSEDKINLDGSATNPWRLCSIQQVEEAKCWVRIIPIWASAIIFHIPLIQQNTYAVLQALQLDRRLDATDFTVPAATYVIFIMITLTVWIPIYDRLLVPYLERLTGKDGGLTLLQRMGIGIALSIICMLVSGLVEEHRRNVAFIRPTLGISPKGGSISSMSGMWLVPQLALAGLAEGFNYVAQIEFYYKQFPENMRSIAQSLFFAGYAISSYLSGFLISITHQITSRTKTGDWLAEDLNKGKLDYYYYMIGGLGLLNFVYFLASAKWYRYRGADDSTDEKAKETKKSLV
ncbi:protein NRT1/ PTR FAMILY 2.11 isoform X2 [Ricinus communis]|uniref:protein NRT1/ PTR FAMILY 2.11 isoform X2 n=1 Tax=Ricinus communis TaxID=3988 RepID=UPI00201ACBFA|nr:protein NRT1/ PTR FAMILY 2.11 isoform X2 [Ricinus communis]